MNLVRCHVQPAGHTCARLVHLLSGAARGRKTVIGLDLGLQVIAVQRIDHLPAGVGTTRVFEVCKAL